MGSPALVHNGGMRTLAGLLVLTATGTAYAQAPGQVRPGAAGPARPSVMDDRWAVAFGLATEGLTPQHVDGASNVQFAGLELAARYRITAPIEVALSLFAAGSAGDLSTASVFADVRYRFFADRPWNVYLLGGLGVASAGSKHGTDAQKKGRGAVRFGIGGERRFGRLAIYAELRVIGIASNPTAMHTDNSTADDLARYSLGGGALELGGTFYF